MIKKLNKFQTTVSFETTKKEFDSARNKRMNAMEWLYDNVGPSANMVLEEYQLSDENWDSNHTYSDDNKNIIETYSFKNPNDATLFALKWS